MKIAFLLPRNLDVDSKEEMKLIYEFYKKLLCTSCDQAIGEYHIWRQIWKDAKIPKSQMPKDAIEALVKCDKDALPTIHRLLQILACRPVSTVSAERSSSNLRRLKTWLRSTMKEDRHSELALLSLNRQTMCPNETPEVLNRFAHTKNRRLNLLL